MCEPLVTYHDRIFQFGESNHRATAFLATTIGFYGRTASFAMRMRNLMPTFCFYSHAR